MKEIRYEMEALIELNQLYPNSQTLLTKAEPLKLKIEKAIELSHSVESNTAEEEVRCLIQKIRLKLRKGLQSIKGIIALSEASINWALP